MFLKQLAFAEGECQNQVYLLGENAMSVLVLLDEIANALEKDSDRVRIRKLIFCACKNRWENDKSILLSFSLPDLLLELYQNNTTVEKLTASLYKIVQKLNRKAEYSAVANTIVNQLDQLYEDSEDEMTKFATIEDSTQFAPFATPASPLLEIVRELEDHEEKLRIRKLLFCTCYSQWENNPQKLLDLNLQQLLEVIQQKYLTLNELKLGLEGIIENLNRKQEYAKIGNFLIDRLDLLYPNSKSKASLSIQTSNSNGQDEITIGTHFANHSLEEASAFAEENSAFAAVAAYSTSEDRCDRNGISDDISIAKISPQSELEWESQQAGDDTTNYTPTPDTDFDRDRELTITTKETATISTIRDYDPFQVRLEVMKYSNPLRAKILAFSTLHHKFEITSQEWSSLRTLSFDELLQNLYENYPNITALEKPLYDTANGLASPDESNQAAEAIVQAMKPYYP
ncbi:hypothetical protein [Spirulina sp. 06S082]|uniref:hypothetical protein n=1 Tax=Spirulina sp. 06S082 TaxID=3110248 RepID=UPI002B202B07|nr:hypothetical protein [Spirulina sp. 06S082]MEA5469552.1 hypothetical protein [Spirulina sp. 06S082]